MLQTFISINGHFNFLKGMNLNKFFISIFLAVTGMNVNELFISIFSANSIFSNSVNQNLQKYLYFANIHIKGRNLCGQIIVLRTLKELKIVKFCEI